MPASSNSLLSDFIHAFGKAEKVKKSCGNAQYWPFLGDLV